MKEQEGYLNYYFYLSQKTLHALTLIVAVGIALIALLLPNGIVVLIDDVCLLSGRSQLVDCCV